MVSDLFNGHALSLHLLGKSTLSRGRVMPQRVQVTVSGSVIGSSELDQNRCRLVVLDSRHGRQGDLDHLIEGTHGTWVICPDVPSAVWTVKRAKPEGRAEDINARPSGCDLAAWHQSCTLAMMVILVSFYLEIV